MRRLILAGLAGVALTTVAQPAHAWPTRSYGGGCGFNTVNDTTPNGPLGGADRWNGVAYVAVYATDEHSVPLPASTISIDCEVYVNGVLTDVAASASGIGAATSAGTFSFEAGPTDWVNVCERVVVDGEEIHTCGWTGDPIPPEPIPYLLGNGVNALNEAIFEPIVDPIVCPTAESPVWDCPPYGD